MLVDFIDVFSSGDGAPRRSFVSLLDVLPTRGHRSFVSLCPWELGNCDFRWLLTLRAADRSLSFDCGEPSASAYREELFSKRYTAHSAGAKCRKTS